MRYSREQGSTYQEEEEESKSENPSQGKSTPMSNSEALEKLTGGDTQKTNVDVSSAQDGPSFASAASKALDAVVAGPGASASLKISGKLPIYATGALNAFLMPALSLSALRLSSGKLKVTIDSELGLRAEAGTGGGGGWWPKFLAYFQGKIKGTIRIVGDDAQEVFNELLLTFRLVLEQACDVAGAPSSITDAVSGAIMSSESKEQTIENMDGSDSVETLLERSKVEPIPVLVVQKQKHLFNILPNYPKTKIQTNLRYTSIIAERLPLMLQLRSQNLEQVQPWASTLSSRMECLMNFG